jgi:hypothetical protein
MLFPLGTVHGRGYEQVSESVPETKFDNCDSHCHIQTVPPSQPAANTGPLGCQDIHCEYNRSSQRDPHVTTLQTAHGNLITSIETGQKLPRSPSLHGRLILIGLLALDTTPNSDFSVHPSSGYHITVRGESTHNHRVGVSGQSDRLESSVVDRVF